MKIGVMTMHRVPNYGSFMQAYSLKRMIESLGHEVSFVDYHVKPDIEHRGRISEKAKCSLKTLARRIKGIPCGRALMTVAGMKRDADREIMFSCNGMLGVDDSYHYRTPCDVLVIGSDEVFNCLQPGDNVGFSPELFGVGARARRVVSYAASFGNTTLEKLERNRVSEEVGSYLNRIDEISVRDENSAEVVRALTGRDPLLHFDPVLVGGAEHEKWSSCERRNYVVLYGYANRFTEEECRKVMEFAHARELEVLAVGEDQLVRDEHVRCKPDEVMSLFSNADYVVTDTFHGTIFSVVTHRSFLSIPRADRNGQGGNEQKLTYLLKGLGLSDRMVGNLDDIDEQIRRPIDFDRVDEIRRHETSRSMDYLRDCFEIGSYDASEK